MEMLEKDHLLKEAIEEHPSIIFMIRADKYKYSKLMEDIKNGVLRKKDPFPKPLLMYYPDGKTNMVVSTMAIEVNQMMVLPSQQ